MISILKFACLLLAIWWSLVNATRLVRGLSIPTLNLFLQAVGIAGFVWLQWLTK